MVPAVVRAVPLKNAGRRTTGVRVGDSVGVGVGSGNEGKSRLTSLGIGKENGHPPHTVPSGWITA